MKTSETHYAAGEPAFCSPDYSDSLPFNSEIESEIVIGNVTIAPSSAPITAALTEPPAQPAEVPPVDWASGEARVGAPRSVTHLALLDPVQIRISDIPNRLPDRFTADALRELTDSIFESKGNRTPIEVRLIGGQGPEDSPGYELVAGARRLHVCIQLKLPVLAIVTNAAAPSALNALIENCNRADLSPYESGRQLRRALDETPGLSQNRLALAVGCSSSNISRALQIASLPNQLIDAFVDPCEIRFADAAPLTNALAHRTQAVLDEAEAIAKAEVRLPANQVVKRLLAAGEGGIAPCNTPARYDIVVNGQTVGETAFDERGRPQIRISLPLTPDEQTRLRQEVQALLEKIKRPAPRRARKNAATDGPTSTSEPAADRRCAAEPDACSGTKVQP